MYGSPAFNRSMIAYPDMLNRYDPEVNKNIRTDSFLRADGSDVQQMGNQLRSAMGNLGGMGASSVQQGIGSLLGIIDQNINQNPETSRLMGLRQILLDYNNQFGGGSMQPSRGFAQPLSQRLGGRSPLMGLSGMGTSGLMGLRRSLMPTGMY